jgi:hypothetical protein
MNDDERIKGQFDKLRREDARRAPSFESVRKGRGKRGRRRSAWLVPVGTVVAAAAAMVVWCGYRVESESSRSASVALAPEGAEHGRRVVAQDVHDDAPLDFLLEVDGLRGVPNFDTGLLKGSLR